MELIGLEVNGVLCGSVAKLHRPPMHFHVQYHLQCHLLPAPTRLGWEPQSCGSALAGSADKCPALSLGRHEAPLVQLL